MESVEPVIEHKPPRKKRAPNKNPRDDYISFGRLVLNKTLLKDNILLVKHNNPTTPRKSPVPLLRRTTISDTFRELIDKYLKTNIIDVKIQKQMNSTEQNVLKTLLYVAKIDGYKDFEYKSKSTHDYVEEFHRIKNEYFEHGKIEHYDELKSITTLLSNPIIGKLKDEAEELLVFIDEYKLYLGNQEKE
jgi:hypothetical protein